MPRMNLAITFRAVTAGTVLLSSSLASAQTVDYSAHEELFGEPVTTSATGQPQRLSTVPVNMTIITQEEIRTSGLDNIPEILDRYTGVNTRRRSRNAFDVAVRGYNQPSTNRLLVMLNNRQVYLDAAGTINWSAIPVQLDEIRQIELVRGPNAALFGFNAAAGVVNIVTFNPLYDDLRATTLRAGNDDFIQSTGVFTVKPHERLGLRVSGGNFNVNEFLFDNNPTPAAFDETGGSTFNTEALLQVTDTLQVGGEFGYSNAASRILSPASQSINDLETYAGRVSVHADTQYGLTTFRAYHNDIGTDVVPLSPAPTFVFDNTVTVAQLENLAKIGADHAVRVGLEYRNHEMNAITTDPTESGRVGYTIGAVSGMWNYTLNQDINLIAAGRYDALFFYQEGDIAAASGLSKDDFDRRINNFSGNLAAVWQPTAIDTIRIGAGRAAVLPSLTEAGAAQVSFASGDPSVDPTTVTNVEISYDRELPGTGVTGRSSVFYQINEDFRDFALVAPGSFRTSNVGDSSLIGFEIGADGTHVSDGFLNNIRWNTSYTALFINDDLDNETGLDFNETTPSHEVEARLGTNYGPLDLDLFGRYVSKFGLSETNLVTNQRSIIEIDDFAQLDLRLAYNATDDVLIEFSGQQFLEDNIGVSRSTDNERRFYVAVKMRY